MFALHIPDFPGSPETRLADSREITRCALRGQLRAGSSMPLDRLVPSISRGPFEASGQALLNQLLKVEPSRLPFILPDRLPGDLIPFAAAKGLIGVTVSALSQWGVLSRLDPEELKKAKTSLVYTEMLNIGMKRELESLFSRFNAEGLKVVLFKGHDLINRCYRDFKTRPTTDADIIIREADLPVITKILEGEGYRRQWEESPSNWIKGSFMIDLHLEFVDVGRISMSRYLPKIPTHEVIKEATHRQLGNATYLSPDTYHAIIMTALHSLTHSYLKDFWFMDVGKLIIAEGESFSMDRLMEIASRWGLSGVVLFMLWALQELFGFPMKMDFRSDYRVNPVVKRLISAATRSRRYLQFGDLILGLYIDSPVKKLYYFKEMAYPKRDVMAREMGLESAGRLRLYLMRTIYLVKSLLGILFKRNK